VIEVKPSKDNDEVTRREWMLILGRLAAIAGFSGIVPELAAALPGVEGPGNKALPPGLYYPSHDHLSHALGDLGSMHTIPPDSETEYVKPPSGVFRSQFFSDEEFKIVTRVTEILLGKVDAGALAQSAQWIDLYLHSASGVREAALKLDPLHRALAVAYYGGPAVRELEINNPQTVVRSGIAALQELSKQQYGQGFLGIDDSQQEKLVSMMSAAQPDGPLRTLFETTRTEAARGYYTTAEGLKELDYKGNWYYGVCPGCERGA
jgi:Gluconate 2-dehydrogenase subunit 3